MYREFLMTSSLLALPLVALVIFAIVFVTAVVRAMLQSRAEVDTAARLPLAIEEGSHER